MDKGTKSAAACQLEEAVWPSGCYWQPSMQPASQMAQVAEHFDAHVTRFGVRFERAAAALGLGRVAMLSLGARLQEVAIEVAEESHPFGKPISADEDMNRACDLERFRTLVHGDPKAANMFFRTREHEAGSGPQLDVAIIDFQWSGFGLAATDVSHHIVAALAPEALNANDTTGSALAAMEEAEKHLLDAYHCELCEALVANGCASTAEQAALEVFSRATLQAQYETAVLDMGRLVFAYQWSRADFGVPALNRNSYNKDVRSAAWLATRCDALLNKRHA